MQWTDPTGTRIWRSPAAGTTADDILNSEAYYTDEVLAGIAVEGFTGIWVFCELYNVMRSTVFPELNRPRAEERLAALQILIDRGRKHGIGIYLYFNEPMGVNIDHPFWTNHPDLKGVEKWHCYALCTSTPEVQAFFRDALESTFSRLRDLEGVILITGNEGLTHCWSKHTKRPGDPPPPCPRCQEREPADLVLELLKTWAEVSRAQATPFRILAWNWEWILWYPNPQLPIVEPLPAEIELLLGYEMTGTKQWHGRTITVGEYALSFPGPCEQFLLTRQAAAERGIPVHAKIELNNTHEICSVPNIPVLQTIHARFAVMTQQGIAGMMGCWSMSGTFNLNTRALAVFLRDPARYVDEETFLSALAKDYFGCTAPDAVIRAWRQFSAAFTHYPFSVQVLYYGPHNDAPARPLSLHFTGKPIGRSFANDEPGDDLSRLFSSHVDGQTLTLEEVIEGFTMLADEWEDAARLYASSLENNAPGITDDQSRHRQEEAGCARMIGVQMRSVVNVYRFFQAQQHAMQSQGLTAPCDIPANEALLGIMREEIANAARALPLVDADRRLGYHRDTGGYKYNGETIRAKIRSMEEEFRQ
ncbi:MAG: hypothetical protein ACYC7E_13180 [Armatimonadota bacterium]